MSGRAPVVLAADFEATTDEDDCRVWAYGYAYINRPNNVEVGTTLIGFIRECVTFGNATIYFHNLKYDGSFIVDWLLNHDYIYSEERWLEEMQFSALYSGDGKMYSLTVKWSADSSTEFRDSLKKLPFSIGHIADSFDLPVKKGDIDYHKYRPVGYELTEEEVEYVENDVSILAYALQQTYAEGMHKLTVGADSLDEYKKLTGVKRFRKLFPVLAPDIDADIRRGYRGGYTYAAERFRARKIETQGVVLDVNSLYPSVMYQESLPFGAPIVSEGKPADDGRLHIFEVTFTAKLRKKHIPIIQVKKSNRFHESEYLDVINDPVTLMVTDVDWKMYNDHYKIDVYAYGKCYSFEHTKGMFADYIDKWMMIKENSTGGTRQLAKLHLNSLYGKFATGIDVTGRYPEIDGDRVKWRMGDEETRDPIYTAMGAFITAYARRVCITAAQANFDTFAYADTDSLHLLRPDIPDTIDVHPSNLGAWKHEYNFTAAFYMRAKAYIERTPLGERVVRVAGLPVRVSEKLDFADFYDGNVIHGKLVPRIVPGGTILVDVPYELKM